MNLTYTIDTHVHADHLTSATKLKALVNSKIVYPKQANLPCADMQVEEGRIFNIGSVELHPLFIPGHTCHYYAYLFSHGPQQMVLTGDAGMLYDSIHNNLFNLPDEILIYPAHDYEGRFISSIGQ